MKKIITVLSVLVAVSVLGFGMYHSAASPNNQLLSEKEITSLISSQYPGEITNLTLNDDNNNAFYQAKIKGDTAEYELKMNAESGEVLKLKETKVLANKDNSSKDDQNKEATKKKKEQDKDKNKQNNKDKNQSKKDSSTDNNSKNKQQDDQQKSQSNKSNNSNQSSTSDNNQNNKKEQQQSDNNDQQVDNSDDGKKAAISRDKALEIALSRFSGEVDDVDLEEEDGRLIYEIEIERGELEAEIEIDAYTGEVLIMEVDD